MWSTEDWREVLATDRFRQWPATAFSRCGRFLAKVTHDNAVAVVSTEDWGDSGALSFVIRKLDSLRKCKSQGLGSLLFGADSETW